MKISATTPLIVSMLLVFSLGCTDQNISTSSSNSPDAAEVVVIEDREGSDGIARVTAAIEKPDKLDRVEALIPALRAVPASEVEFLETILANRNSFLPDIERVLVIARWAQIDPAGATSWSLAQEQGETRNSAIQESVYNWAKVDPEAVVQNHDVEKIALKSSFVIRGLVDGWFESGVGGLNDFISSMSDPDNRSRAQAALVRNIVERDGPEDAITWAEGQLIPDEEKRELFRRMAGEIAKTHPQATVEWCNRLCELNVGNTMPQFIARSWGRRDDAGEMMEWLFTLPVLINAKSAAGHGYRQFRKSNPEAAAAWMENSTIEQRRSDVLQGIVVKYINEKSWKDPKSAMEWTEYITNEPLRRHTMIQVARKWLNLDPGEAEAWLVESPLTDDEKMHAHETVLEHRRLHPVQQRDPQ